MIMIYFVVTITEDPYTDCTLPTLTVENGVNFRNGQTISLSAIIPVNF